MHLIVLDNDTDFEGWRKAARQLASHDVRPADVTWQIRSDDALLPTSRANEMPDAPQVQFNVPARFVELARTAILHCHDERFALLYRLLWRLRSHHDLLGTTIDPDVAEVHAMARAVYGDIDRMHAHLRFREIGREHKAHYVAWFEPEHHIVASAAPFFASRFADMPWSILTPDVCAHWDGHAISITSGIAKSEVPSEDRLEEVWRRHHNGLFNPARLKLMEAPQAYWRNLPEDSIIKPLIEDAMRMTSGPFIARRASEPQKRQDVPIPRKQAHDRQAHEAIGDAIAALREEAAACRACPLWKDATQTVFGEGPQNATLMLVGEQPGDKEDLAGHPFVGPAGQMLDRALKEAGIDRAKVYITNAVKHFKFVQRGKVRLHQKPGTAEIRTCRPWYQRELAAVRPELVVALGATAAQSVLGKITPINKNRGRLIEHDGTRVLVTVHPSYLLRLPDESTKALEYQRFIDDLKIAAGQLRDAADAA
ncbi:MULTISPECIES: UdgX family uracil-DNA binding protein [Bradyrhizobium]|jgi:DNA polymerase|uniref:UdgX family uracil-DNA binding protein n=1 Tax=Bradyrhizobium TaxID=374 RepID=UPI0003FBD4F4|nr:MULTISPECIES: UdgX family uracil-DNA binding protein [Bradyrhizobium]KIU45220.1 DNA polymerase [Bradyrhizobium elkanii]MBK5654835.1 UdgX family uracil-DNA binding protein [Rhizobium sp.]OCX30244.1 uracil-DNA glycosylase [Bradyrhizobium sp. UASWS1016]